MNKFLRFLSSILLCLPVQALAAGTFFWNCESETLDSNSHSAGDTTATVNGGISVSATSPLKGSNSCVTDGSGSDYYIFDSASIGATGETAFGIMFRWVGTPGFSSALHKPMGFLDSADNDAVGLLYDSSNHPRLNIRKNGNAALSLTLATAVPAADTTYFITAAWDIAGDRRFIRLYDSSCALIQEQVDTTTNLGSDQPDNFNQIRIGNATGTAGTLKVDTVIVASDYDDPVIDACPWTSFFPTFSSALAAGTIDDTSIQVTYTPDQIGTGYGVACPNGQTASGGNGGQIRAGNCSGGAAAASWSEAGVAGVGETKTFTGLSPGTTYDIFVDYENTLGGDKASVSTLADQTTTSSTPPGWASGPTVTGIADGFRIAGTPDATATMYVVCYPPVLGTPSAAQLKAGNNINDGAGLYAGNESWAGADTLDVTASNKPFRTDCAVLLSNGDGDSDITVFEDKDRLPPTGWAQTILVSVAAYGYCDQDSFFDPDCAVGHGVEYETTTNESADCLVTIATDGDVQFSLKEDVPGVPNDPAACDNRLTFELNYEYTGGSTALYTAPTVGNFVTPDTAVIGNQTPVCFPETDPIILQWKIDLAITPQNLKILGGCNDAEGDQLTATIVSGSLPTGLSQSGTGDLDLDGTPTVEDENGAAVIFRLTDIFGAYAEYDALMYPIDTVTMPTCVGQPTAACSDLIALAFPWRVDDFDLTITALTCSVGTPGLVLTQSPTASSEAEPDATFEVTQSRSCSGSGNCSRPGPLPPVLPSPLPPSLPECPKL